MDPIDLYRHFRRALRACQLYPEGSRIRMETSDRLARKIAEAIEEHVEGVSLSFLEDGAYVDGIPVPAGQGEEEADGLSDHLFNLGVREIRFLIGIHADEVLRLLEVLTRARSGELNPVDEDLSILLWESDLTHVGYLLYEEDEPEADDVSHEQLEVEEMISNEPPLDDYLATDEEIVIQEMPLSAPAGLTEAERLAVIADYRNEIAETTPLKYGRLLLEILRVENDTKEVPRLEKYLVDYLEVLMTTERFAILANLEKHLGAEGGEIDSVHLALGRARDWFLQSELYIRAARAHHLHPSDGEAAKGFLARVPKEVVPDLVSLCLDERSEDLAGSFEQIRVRIRESAEVQRICLSDPRPEVRKLALEESCGLDRETAHQVRELMTTPDPEVRVRAAWALSRTDSHEAYDGLAEALEDPEPRVRVAAAGALAQRGGAKALELLLRIVVSKNFAKKAPEEKRAFFHAAGRVSPEEVLPVLARLAEQRGFWPSRERSERAEAALEAMSRLGPEAREFLMQRWRRKRPDLLRRFERFWIEADSAAPARQEAA